jgi:hypothetical protein
VSYPVFAITAFLYSLAGCEVAVAQSRGYRRKGRRYGYGGHVVFCDGLRSKEQGSDRQLILLYQGRKSGIEAMHAHLKDLFWETRHGWQNLGRGSSGLGALKKQKKG